MSRVDRRGKGSGDGVLLVALLVVGVLLGRLQTGAAKGGGLDPFGLVVRDAVALIGNPLNALFDGTGDFSRRLREGDRLARENDALKARLNAMALYEEQLALKDDQIANLRGLAGLKPLPGRERVSADIVDFVPYEGRITLNVGSERGVAPNMPVICADGLVAIVQTVWRGGCQAALITNASISVGAMDLSRKPPSGGIIKGRDPSTLILTFFDPDAAVQTGDTVVTTGHSTRIPRMLRIGRVVAREDDLDFGIRRALVVPFMTASTLKEVQILR